MFAERGEPLSVNMAPLIDVMLVILVLFLITSPLVPEPPEVQLPQVFAQSEPLKESVVVLVVTEDGHVHFRGTDVTDRVEQSLLDDAALKQEGQLYVRGDERASFEAVADVLAAARRAGITRLNLIVDPLDPETARRIGVPP